MSETSNRGNTLFPIFLKLENFRVLIIGGGVIGLEKISAVLNNSPLTDVTLVAENILPELIDFAAGFPNTKIIRKKFEETDLDGKDFVISAVNDKMLSKEITLLAKARRILINVADTPDLCDFYLSSIVKKGDLKIAISTNGKSPTMAKRVKEVLNASFPEETQSILDNLGKIRAGLSGDFANKVKELNRITSVLVEKGVN
ncbi:MAG: bifunctional precorrin-2 dehydrogenase/sirohydrochlorin ferrochelatase [Bacteroidetes bacterium]|nr:bifunctional precorrin-2 dehydrogenase/sirohydrochlorin ferrochelatase [Bacteroidota bacterium]